MASLAVLSVVVTIGMLISVWSVTRKARELDLYQKYTEDFISGATALLADDDTPEAIVGTLEFARMKLASDWAALDFLRFMILNRRRISNPGVHAEQDKFRMQRPELGKVFNRTLFAALMAVTYRGGIFGRIVRTFYFSDAREEKVQELVTTYRDVECDGMAAHA